LGLSLNSDFEAKIAISHMYTFFESVLDV
jgi:hypothetical protein